MNSEIYDVCKYDAGSLSGGNDFLSAYLGPNLWNTTINDENLELEYMDLDEFLSENDSNSNSEEQVKKDSHIHIDPGSICSASSFKFGIFDIPNSSENQNLLDDSLDYAASDLQIIIDNISIESVDDDISKMSTAECPGQEGFDPVNRRFTDDELKPQPIIRKSKKIFIPDSLKDTKYWSRRNKNNIAAKGSRNARRVKENQIAMRASFLESENESMKQELIILKRENNKLKNSLSKYLIKQ